MSEIASQDEKHIEQGDLVRYLDGEMPRSERASIAAHLLRCRRCSSALDGLKAERRLIADMLAQLEVPEISASRRERSWAGIERAAARKAAEQRLEPRRSRWAAAAAAGIAVGALTVSPVRAFVADVWTGVASRTGIVRTAVVEPAPIRVAGATIGFVPTGRTLVLEVRSTQSAGALILGVNDGGSVNAQAEGGDQVVDIRILPGSGMRIENDQHESGSYAVNVPTTLEQVRIRIGDRPEIVYDIETLEQSWVTVIDLTSGSASPAAGSAP